MKIPMFKIYDPMPIVPERVSTELLLAIQNETSELPQRWGHDTSIGLDLTAFLPKETLTITQQTLVGTGVGINLKKLNREDTNKSADEEWFAMIVARSSNPKVGFTVQTGIVDVEFSGAKDELKVWILPMQESVVTIAHRQRIAQLVVFKALVTEVEECEPEEKNRGGFGSTGQ